MSKNNNNEKNKQKTTTKNKQKKQNKKKNTKKKKQLAAWSFITVWANSATDKFVIFFFIFPRKQDLTFHANCLQWRRSAASDLDLLCLLMSI